MKKLTLIGVNLCTVVLLILGSLSNVVGYQSAKSTVNDSPLFQTRTQRATNQQQNIMTSQYLGMSEKNFLQFPIRDNRTGQLKKAIGIISKMDDTTFAQFTELCIQKARQDDTLRDISRYQIVQALHLLKIKPESIINSLTNTNNKNMTSSEYYSLCHWFPGCILINIMVVIYFIVIVVFGIIFFWISLMISCAHTCQGRSYCICN